jgi:succinoglycan biosynthesis transport protein ExoP
MSSPLFFCFMDSSKLSSPQEAKLHFLDYWRIIRIRKTVILAVFLLVVITATVVTFILPESFVGSARVNVQREGTEIQGVSGAQPIQTLGIDPYFIQTEFEVMQSQVILDKVIDKLNLAERWGTKFRSGEPLTKSEARSFLKGSLDIRPVRNTSLIEIRVFSDKADEAAELANAMAEAYQTHRLEARYEKMDRSIKVLHDQLAKHQSELQVAQSNVDFLRGQFKVQDLNPQATEPTPTLSTEEMQKKKSEILELNSVENSLDTKLEKLRGLAPRELRGAIQTVMDSDPELNNYITDLNTAEQGLISLQKKVTEEHPDYASAQLQIDRLNKKIDERVGAIMFGWEARLASVRAQIASVTNQLTEAIEKDIKMSTETRPYWDAKAKLADLRRYRELLELKIKSETTDRYLPSDVMVEIIDKATPNSSAVRPNKPLNIVLGVIVGIVVGVGLAFFIEYLDTSVKTIDDVERTLQAPVLGVIPQNVGFLLEEGAESPHAEAYRVLRTNLLFSRKEDKLNSVAVVSAGAGEGKSTTVFNLATVFAQNGSRVVIVDSDLRRPTLHKMVGVTNSIGLTNYLLKQNSLEEVIQTSNLPTLDFMASGKLPSSSLGILSSSQMKELITELKRRYDFVFFDSPPIMGVSDASILASEVDMTLQVIQYRRYPQPMNIRAKQMIEKVGGNLIGIVLNNINVSQDENYYYYSGYYNEYYSKAEDDAEPSGAVAGDKNKTDIKPKY